MSKNQRMIIEAFAPPFLATVCLVIMSFRQESLSDVFLGFLPCLLFAYAFGIFPALLFMVVMELWFYFGFRRRCGLLCTVGLSGILGFGAGLLSALLAICLGLLTQPDSFWLAKIGLIVGLLIGFYVARKETSAA